MPVDSTNRYGRYRRAAGLTQERAAELLAVSVESIKAYETNQRLPPDDVVATMCDVYQSPVLAVEHLRSATALGARVLPAVASVAGPQAVCALLLRIKELERNRICDQLVQIAADGRIDELEAGDFAGIIRDLQDVIAAAMAVSYANWEGR